MVEKIIRLISQGYLWLLLTNMLIACSTVQEEKAWDPLIEDSQIISQGIDRSSVHLSPAIASLLKKADTAIEKQQWQQAIAYLERALRINAKQAEIWTRMAIVYLGQYNPQQSIHMAKRSNSYARDNQALLSYNWLLISRAYRMMQRQDLAEQADLKSQQLHQAIH